jgi:hypothetical protein
MADVDDTTDFKGDDAMDFKGDDGTALKGDDNVETVRRSRRARKQVNSRTCLTA